MIKTPFYIMDETLLRRNLSLIRSVAQEADVEIILAFKAFALWKTFPIFREYINATTASSPWEARLAYEEFGSPAHTYSPAYEDSSIDDVARWSSHLTFNSLSQYAAFHERVNKANPDICLGLRINPGYSEVETDIYNPCAAGTRFGVRADRLPRLLPSDISGFHCHCHCESGSDVFARTLTHIEEQFAPWFNQLKWINFGGGHLMTRSDYDVPLLISLLRGFHNRYPHLKIILEPGSAFAWQTGDLHVSVVDVVEDCGIRTAIINSSFTCHMPDCLEMPYQPVIEGAEIVNETMDNDGYIYRIGGNSCLSGDFVGYWRFDHELRVGETLILKDMIHYTTVKTSMFNGICHPSILLRHTDGSIETLREYSYDDYKSRMD